MQALHLFDHTSARNPRRIFLFCFPLFFIFLADSVMSYMFPILVARTTQSNTMLGVIMALSSVLGIMCDFTFPQLLRNRSWKFQLTVGIIIALLFPLFSNLGALFSLIFFFVIATLIWGVYFEFLQFSQQNFVIGEASQGEYSKDWGILFLIYELTINLGPVVGSFLLTQHVITSNMTVNAFQIISLIFALIVMMRIPSHKKIERESQIGQTIGLLKELKIWKRLGQTVWPAIFAGITISCINASFWTLGGLLGMEIIGNGFDWLVMVLFGVPLILGSLLLTKIPIHTRKKHFSQLSIIVGGILLTAVVLFKSQPVIVLSLIAISSFSISFAGPLNEAVYSDLLKRSGKSKLHLLGIAKSNTSLAFIIAPLFCGFIADKTDYYTAFSIVGGIAVCVGLLLLLFSPKKIKLSEQVLRGI